MTDPSGIGLHNGILPSHTKIDIWEEYARHVLSWLEPSLYSSLILADKPDLVDADSGLGVEVTWSVLGESKEIDALYPQYRSERDPEKRKCFEERLLQLNASINEYMCLHPTENDDFSLIQDSHRKKLRLLNQGGYRPFEHNHLFIISDILADEAMLKDALLKFERTAANYSIHFEQVIVAAPEYVYTFNLRNISYHVTELDNGRQYELAMAARRRVLDAERNPQR